MILPGSARTSSGPGAPRWPPGCRRQAGCCLERLCRKCGKEGCRCTQGELHGPYTYLQVAGRLVYVPAGLAETVARHVEVSALLRELLEEISAVNLELLARRELD